MLPHNEILFEVFNIFRWAIPTFYQILLIMKIFKTNTSCSLSDLVLISFILMTVLKSFKVIQADFSMGVAVLLNGAIHCIPWYPALGSQKASGLFQQSGIQSALRIHWGLLCLKTPLKKLFVIFTLLYKHFCFIQNYWFQLWKETPYISGLCANKLKKETKQTKKILFCTVGGILSIFVLVPNLIFMSVQRCKLSSR